MLKTKEEFIEFIDKELNPIANFFNVSLTYKLTNKTNLSGYYLDDQITLFYWEKVLSKQELYSTFFHELSHFLREKENPSSQFVNIVDLKSILKQALRDTLEEYLVDRYAKKLMVLFVDEYKFNGSYPILIFPLVFKWQLNSLIETLITDATKYQTALEHDLIDDELVSDLIEN